MNIQYRDGHQYTCNNGGGCSYAGSNIQQRLYADRLPTVPGLSLCVLPFLT